jgi:hypothetical protein
VNLRNWPWTTPQPDPAAERVRACVAELVEKSQAAQYVLIARVLQIIDPEGKLGTPHKPDPRADPLLGTMPVDPAAYAPRPPESPQGG